MREFFKKFVNLLRPILVELVKSSLEDLLSKPAPKGVAHSPKSVKAACNKAVDDYLAK